MSRALIPNPQGRGKGKVQKTADGLPPDDDNHRRIFRAVMAAGGETLPIHGQGVTTLDERVVKLHNKRGFFFFETFEKIRRKLFRYSRQGSTNYVGDYPRDLVEERQQSPAVGFDKVQDEQDEAVARLPFPLDLY